MPRWTAVGLAALLLVVGCGNGTGSTPTSAAGGLSLERGRQLYEANCAVCHGADLLGTNMGPSFLDRVYEPSHHADAAFFLAVRIGVPAHHWGFGDMPPVPGLTEEDVADIVAYVRARQVEVGIG